MLAEKVVNISPNKLYSDIITFIESRPENTGRAYSADIRSYFKIMCQKELEEVTIDDLQLRLADVERYKTLLQKMGYAKKTVNRRLNGLRKLLRYLQANEYDVKYEFFSEIKSLKGKPKSYGLLTPEEVFFLADVALTEREKGLTKHFLILTAFMTSIRLEALLQVKWTDIVKADGYYIINAVDKGDEEVRRSISENFYNKLIQLKQESPTYVFNIEAKAMRSSMNRIVEKAGIPKERNIKFHSLRGAGTQFVLDMTGDPKAAMRQSGHKSFDVWWNSYINKGDVDFNQMAGMLIEQDVDCSIVDKLTKEQIKQVIQKLNKKSQIEFIKISKEILSQ